MVPPSVLSSSWTWLSTAAVSSPHTVIFNTVEFAPVMVAAPEYGNMPVAVERNGSVIAKVAVPLITVLANLKVIVVIVPAIISMVIE